MSEEFALSVRFAAEKELEQEYFREAVERYKTKLRQTRPDVTHRFTACGLTKRQYFAGLAMQNLQNVLLRKSGAELLTAMCVQHKTNIAQEAIAKESVKQADALLKALSEK